MLPLHTGVRGSFLVEFQQNVNGLLILYYEQAVDTAVRVLKEGGMDAIKLEGGAPSRITAAKAIVEAGIAVIGHVGLTPQAISVLGGFRPQGRNIDSAVKVYLLKADRVHITHSIKAYAFILVFMNSAGCGNCHGLAESRVLFRGFGMCACTRGCSSNISSSDPHHWNWCGAFLQWSGWLKFPLIFIYSMLSSLNVLLLE